MTKQLKPNPWLIEFPRLVMVIFIILNFIAIFSYPGGTYLDQNTIGYSLTKNFLSDLGRTISFSGEVNFLSAQLFNMTLILAGGVFTIFYIRVRKIFQGPGQTVSAFIGTVFGVAGGLFLAGVGLTPANLYLDLHIMCATWLFRFFFVASFCYTLVIFKHNHIENKYAGGYLLFTVSILAYILISELGPNPKTNQLALSVQVVSQKLILLIFLIAVYVQTFGLQKLHHK